jgi:sulfite reductase (ferredoxin)
MNLKKKWAWANQSFQAGAWSDAIYHSYNVLLSSAKALLLDKGYQQQHTGRYY